MDLEDSELVDSMGLPHTLRVYATCKSKVKQFKDRIEYEAKKRKREGSIV